MKSFFSEPGKKYPSVFIGFFLDILAKGFSFNFYSLF